MTSKQKQKKLDNLAKARAAKAPPKYSQYSQYVVSLEDDHPFSMKKVRTWIKSAREHKAACHRNHVAGMKGALALKEQWAAYINQLEGYLRSGSYTSMFAGENMEKKVQRVCVAMAYHPNGKPKREFGVYYRDWRCVWGPEQENEERAAFGMEPLEFTNEGYIKVERSSAIKTKSKKRKRKPMTEEQKAALVERLKLAREAKAKKAAK